MRAVGSDALAWLMFCSGAALPAAPICIRRIGVLGRSHKPLTVRLEPWKHVATR